MKVISKMIAETKRLASEEEDLRAEVSQLNSELMIEELQLGMLKRESENRNNQVSSVEQSLETAKQQIEFVRSMREAFRSTLLLNSNMKRFVERAGPTVEEQVAKLKDLELKYQEHLRRYEENPTYQAMLAEEASERELRRLVTEKHTETMRLDAQREF